jgi:iron complex transport system substrate-binding protein
MNWQDHILLWNQASIKLMDIRHTHMEPDTTLLSYRLPASGFLYSTQGSATVRLDGMAYMAKPFHIFHGGKGMLLDILLQDEVFDYYLIFYKAVLSLPTGRDKQRLLEGGSPFHIQYSFAPSEPLYLYEKIYAMAERWKNSQAIDKLYVKAVFYQFVHELMSQMHLQSATGNTQDLISQAIRFISERYSESITVETVAESLECSASYLSRSFKNQIGVSTIDYLIQVRIEKSKQFLLNTEAKLHEIAAAVGYSDVYYFSRLFKKHTGFSPLRYRLEVQSPHTVQYNPLNHSDLSMASIRNQPYSINDNNYHFQQREGYFFMIKPARPSISAIILLCFTLILSACQANSNPSAGGKGTGQNPSPVVASQATPESTASAATQSSPSDAPLTRVYEHLNGKTEIPTHPKRIVSSFHVGQLLALGVKPLGSTTYILQNPALDVTGIEDLGVPMNLEKIIALEPDLIILTEAFRDGVSGGYEAFSKVAPTIVVVQNDDPVKDIALFGDILGKQEEASKWLTEFETKIATAKAKVKAVIGDEETFTILNVRQKNFYIYPDANMGGSILYKYLGLKPQGKVNSDVINGETWEVSAEAIPEFIGDHLFLVVNAGAEEALKSNEKIWSNTNAVKNNKIYPLDFNFFLPSDPIAVTKQLDILVDLLLAGNSKS